MKKCVNKYVAICISIVLFIGIIGAIFFAFGNTAFAAEATGYFTAEQYTDSDMLLNEDGTESNKDIYDFVDEVKAAKDNEVISDITKVIPLDILESEEGGIYSYMGKEYGYYIQKASRTFYVLLIDFTFKPYGVSGREFVVRVEPILQQCFWRTQSVGNNVWVKNTDERYNVYVSNPRFVVELNNANALNYGDEGYSKLNDDGFIISQTRFNYSGIFKATTEKKLQAINDFKSEIKFGLACKLLDRTGLGLGTLISDIDSLVDATTNLCKAWEDENIVCNSEDNIKTYLSKDEQRVDNTNDHYMRSISIVPQDKILLSTDGSYAETIVLLSDTNYRSHLLRICKFDIVSVDNLDEPLAGSDGNVGFGSYDWKYLYDNKSHTAMGDDFATANIPVYMLPQGDQFIDFTPSHSGEYIFQIPAGSSLELQGESKNRFTLAKGTKYTFKLKNNFNQKVIAGMSCAAQHYANGEAYQVSPNSDRIIAYQHSSSDYLKFSATNANAKIGILDENLREVVVANANFTFANLTEGKMYYILLKNDTSSTASTQVTLSSPTNVVLGQYSNYSR